MKILAVEFSSENRSVALVRDQAIIAHVVEKGGRRIIGLVEEALKKATWEREDIEAIAVGLGPGSYTGIRGAIAFAQGWELGREIPLIGISSVESIAAQAPSMSNIVIDAQRNEFYLARPDEPLRLATHAEIESRLQAGETVAGPDLGQWFPQAKNIHPDAGILGQLADGRSNFVTGDKLEPIYLRETTFKKAPPLRIIP